MSGILDFLFGGPPQRAQYDWMPPEPSGGGLLGGINNNRYQMMGYLAGALQPGTTQEQISRGLMGAMTGAQSDILNQQRMDALTNQRDQRGAASALIDGEVKAGKISPQDARFFATNPKAWEEYSKARFGATTPVFAPDGTMFMPGPMGKISSPGGVPMSERGETVNPDGSKSPAYFVKPSLTNPQGGIVAPGVVPQAQPAQRPGQPIPSTNKVVGDAEAINRGLYERPSGPVTSMSPQRENEGKKLGDTLGDRYKTIIDEAKSASSTRTTLQRMRQLSDSALEGRASPAIQALRSSLATFGINPNDKTIAAGEEFTALSNKLTLDANGGSLGAGVSNADVSYMGAINPSMANTIAGRRELIETHDALAKRKIDVARMAGEYRRANGTLDGFDSYINDWAEKNPMFKGREPVQDFSNRFGAAAPQRGAIEAEMKRRGLLK